MPPSQDPQELGGGNFENQVRNLFLSSNGTPPSSNVMNGPPGLPGQQLPPHMLPGFVQGQQGPPGHFPQTQSQSRPVVSPANTSHKRPNQAQRRQMNSGLSIPIDSRPVQGVQGVQAHMQGQWSTQPHPQMHQHQRFNNNNQQHSPRFQNSNANLPYTPNSPYSQASPRSPMPPQQAGPSPQLRSGPGPYPNQAPQISHGRPPVQNRQLYQPGGNFGSGSRRLVQNPAEVADQAAELERLLTECISEVGITAEEEEEKERFRNVIQNISRTAIAQYEAQELGNNLFNPSTVELQCFGSMRSGFATKASDMDLALLSPKSVPAPDSHDSAIPRLLEKKLLDLGYGARLLTRTRVPIIKLCQAPTDKLLALLRDERLKWESGFVADLDDHQDDTHSPHRNSPTAEQSKDAVPGSELNLQKATVVSDAEANPKAVTEAKTQVQATVAQSVSMQQKAGQSLIDYYNVAKRILRKVGGRDITPSSPEPTDLECRILNKVCTAFINGLHDPELVSELRSYLSVSPLFDDSLPPLQRTLHGIWLQIEGGKLVLGWTKRKIIEPNEKMEIEAAESLDAWYTLQNKNDRFVESLAYNRQLTMATDRLRRAATLRLVSLEQIPFEEPAFYLGRAQKILEQMQNHQTVPARIITRTVAESYVSGIINTDIREALQNLLTKIGDLATLEQVSLLHRVHQLAADYEHAIKAGMYDADMDRRDIREYVKILRGIDLQNARGPQGEKEAILIARMRLLPDPTQISTNKPRDRYSDHLEFPKTGVGIQCDINFSAQLAIHNTLLLRCYSQCDPRVRPMILFVKHWAKLRGVNTPYRGTLSSYGYVLMVIHYLMNVASPFVLPNLQDIHRDPPPHLSPQEIEARSICNGRDVRFWRNELEIRDLADRKMLNHNHDSMGYLLRGFFEYYAQNGPMSTVSSRGFDWGREVLSLRTLGGIVSKQEKGWTGAKTTTETSQVAAPPTPSFPKTAESHGDSPTTDGQFVSTPKLPLKTVEETKEVRHRYLFAIEDPFELDHNVARTVTHNGIVSIRDEFRRAWRVIKGTAMRSDGIGLLDPIPKPEDVNETLVLMDLIHGPQKAKSEMQV